MKLNTHEAQVAWEDFQGYLIDVGLLQDLETFESNNVGDIHREKNRHFLAKMAFKQGFAIGPTIEKVDVEQDVFVQFSMDPGKEVFRTHRTAEQIEGDNKIVADLLSRNIEPMKLGNIIKCMRGFGRTHWTRNNGSGFVLMAIKMGAPIERVERGVYIYSAAAQTTPEKV